ncbi:MAG: hypothetical protein QOE84_3455 [Actinomycetota bacterium]|nr:hypothetical protein [Actinomycetota bacterium]
MSIRALALAVVACVVMTLASGMGVASASNWAAALVGGSAGGARAAVSPTVPAGVSVACVSATTKTLIVSWSAVAHATYTIYQSTTSATTGFSVAKSGNATTSWTSAVLPLGTYWFQVAAVVGTNWKSANSAAPPSHVIKSTGCA